MAYNYIKCLESALSSAAVNVSSVCDTSRMVTGVGVALCGAAVLAVHTARAVTSMYRRRRRRREALTANMPVDTMAQKQSVDERKEETKSPEETHSIETAPMAETEDIYQTPPPPPSPQCNVVFDFRSPEASLHASETSDTVSVSDQTPETMMELDGPPKQVVGAAAGAVVVPAAAETSKPVVAGAVVVPAATKTSKQRRIYAHVDSAIDPRNIIHGKRRPARRGQTEHTGNGVSKKKPAKVAAALTNQPHTL